MSFPNNHTYKVANGISTISRIDRRAAARKTYACAAGTPYTTDDQILEVITEVDPERLRETMPHLMGLTWDDKLWVRTIIAEKVAFRMRGRFGELEHPIKKELWYTLQRGIYDQDLLEHGATVPRAVRHATAATSLLWSLVREGESKVERLEREVKEAKTDVLRLSAEGLQMKETLAAFQQGTNEALEAMVANHQELIAGLKVRDNNIKGALARRDEKTEELENVVAVLTAQVESLQGKTCNCKEGPKLVGQGTADVPFELEYADEVVLPSPNPSSYATPPIENAVPLPTPGPASTLAASDKENCGRCVLQPIHQLVKIEDEVMEVDRAEDAPRVAELSRMVTSLVEVGEESSAIESTVPTDRSSRRSSFTTSYDSQDMIPPRGPTRETEGRLPTTSIVLSSSHPVMEMWDQVFRSSVTSGRLIGPLEGISSYRLELVVQLSAEDGDAMFGEVLARRGQHYDLRDGRLVVDSLGIVRACVFRMIGVKDKECEAFKHKNCVSNQRVAVKEGLEQLATESAGCLYHIFCHLTITNPTSSILGHMRPRYSRFFPGAVDWTALPYCHTMVMIHALVRREWGPLHIWSNDNRPSDHEHITFARNIAELAQADYQREQKVPGWILGFAFDSLSLDPLPPPSVVADCLKAIAVELCCEILDVVTSDTSIHLLTRISPQMQTELISSLITLKLETMVEADDLLPIVLKCEAICALLPYVISLEQHVQQEMANTIMLVIQASKDHYLISFIASHFTPLLGKPSSSFQNWLITIMAPHINWEDNIHRESTVIVRPT
ncbi:hypothetical protein BJ322DRAFT_1018299 [Thelephora terrestris]|uniref:Uncharacterized protein n=1 Tax=Thelephora terrestris TaxID=56493 RepID=A0A9P6LAU5_9AGAM|nr:hypothetical protein BJ322DRAFT_1018299 [Thelephora terrestris]